MLTPILATDDPYQAAADLRQSGLVADLPEPRDSSDPLACVGLADAQLMLGTSLPQFLPAQSRAHKGAGVEFHLTVPNEDIEAVHPAHRRHAESVTDLALQPWGERAFHAVLLGYRFLIAANALIRATRLQTPPTDSPGVVRHFIDRHHGAGLPVRLLRCLLLRRLHL